MTDRRSPSRASNSTTVDHISDPSPNAALLSATHVYTRRPSSIRSVSSSSIASTSAIAAALRAGTQTPDHGVFDAASSDMTDPRALSQSLRMQSRSPSHTAALVAAARAGQAKTADTTTPSRPAVTKRTQHRPSIAPKPRALSSEHSPSQSSSTINSPNDTSPIPPTTSLVSLFERKSSEGSKKELDPIIIKPVKSLAIQSPKPHRPDGIRSVFKMEVGSAGRLPPGAQQDSRRSEVGLLAQVEQGNNNASDQQRRPSQDDNARTNDAIYKREDSTGGRREEGGQIHSLRDTTESKDFAAGSQASTLRTTAQDKGITTTSPQPKTPISQSRPISRTQTAPIDIRRPPSRPLSTYDTLSTSGQSTQSLSATYRQLYPKKTTPLTTDNELANAIVASSLASSRLGTSSREAPPVPSRRQSRHFFHSRTPSPTKVGLRQTLRKQESSSSDDEDSTHPYGKHQKKRLIRKHPNKHHEGDRKRWRDAVTETERKRYEGVWAANKGLFILPMPRDSNARVDSDTLNDQVSNIVVKDIWSRCRLPEFELEAVWDLVDNESIGRLSKEEFVVGMWLIDQRLKGRKLPVKVQPTVWASVRGIKGIKIRKQ